MDPLPLEFDKEAIGLYVFLGWKEGEKPRNKHRDRKKNENLKWKC